jgi:predicted enzyme related to lactoylglutathione lyase
MPYSWRHQQQENAMSNLNFILLYVENPRKSAELYSKLLGAQPADASDDFVMYALPSGLMVGLWANRDVQPAATKPGGSEVSFTEQDDDAVRATHGAWTKLGLDIIQPPTKMDFGLTFTARDPDGHRLRVFAPAAR